MLDDLDDKKLRRHGLRRHTSAPHYWHIYVRQGSFSVIIAPVDQGDVAEVNRMLEAEASPAEIKGWLDQRAEERWGYILDSV